MFEVIPAHQCATHEDENTYTRFKRYSGRFRIGNLDTYVQTPDHLDYDCMMLLETVDGIETFGKDGFAISL